jgi:hypothetical protein
MDWSGPEGRVTASRRDREPVGASHLYVDPALPADSAFPSAICERVQPLTPPAALSA